jgi:hypothetical protein
VTQSNEDAVSRTAGVPQGDETPSQGPITPPGPSGAANLRIQRAAAAQATIRAQSLATGFRIGDTVTTNTPRSPRYHNRTGRVITTNLGEVGVSFSKIEATDAWFLPAELTRVTA